MKTIPYHKPYTLKPSSNSIYTCKKCSTYPVNTKKWNKKIYKFWSLLIIIISIHIHMESERTIERKVRIHWIAFDFHSHFYIVLCAFLHSILGIGKHSQMRCKLSKYLHLLHSKFQWIENEQKQQFLRWLRW